MDGENGPEDEDEDDYYDDEYEDFFDEEHPRPLAVDEFFNLPFYDPRRWPRKEED